MVTKAKAGKPQEAPQAVAFLVPISQGSSLYLAAGSEEQRDEWFNLLGHFSDSDRRKGPAPTGKILSPRAEGLGGGTQVVDEIGWTDLPMPGPKPAPTTAKPEMPGTLKPILKSKPSAAGGAPVPAIRIPRRIPQDPMEACGDSTRRSSIRFSDEVERREFAVSRAEPVPHNLRAHESRRKPPVLVATAKTASGQPAPEFAITYLISFSVVAVVVVVVAFALAVAVAAEAKLSKAEHSRCRFVCRPAPPPARGHRERWCSPQLSARPQLRQAEPWFLFFCSHRSV